MIVCHEKCYLCGETTDFKIADGAVFLCDAQCSHCGASLRDSDLMKTLAMVYSNDADDFISLFTRLSELNILNTSPYGSIHKVLIGLKGYHCIDILKRQKSEVESNAATTCIGLDNIPFADNSFDLIISEDIFEFVEDYKRVFNEIKRVLRPGGVHVFTVPLREDGETVSRKGKPAIYYKPSNALEGGYVCNEFSFDLCKIVADREMTTWYNTGHRFYLPEEVTILDNSYDEYLQKKDTPLFYYKYNSTVFLTLKSGGSKKSSNIIKGRLQNLQFTGERMVLGMTDVALEIEHLNRYRFAKQFAEGKRVLDAACGTGYGSALLAESAKSVTGIDIAPEAIEFANSVYNNQDNTSFSVASVDCMPFDNASFDVVVSYETLEHIDENQQKKFLSEISRVLTNNGVLVISTPNHAVYSLRGKNEFHVHELDYDEFQEILLSKFKNVHILSQQDEICNIISDSSDSIANLNRNVNLHNCEYMIAVCSNLSIDNINTQVNMRNDAKLQKLVNWSLKNHKLNTKNNEFISQQFKELTSLNNELKQRKLELDRMHTSLNELEQIHSSRAWHLMAYIWKVSAFVIPMGSRRRLFAKLCVKSVRHPVLFFKALSTERVIKFFKMLKEDGPIDVSQHLDTCMVGNKLPQVPLQIGKIDSIAAKSIDDLEKLIIPVCPLPKVSIVIPAYNQFAYTYNCIKSIIDNSKGIPYEIILADDCSTDMTRIIKNVVSGLVLVANKVNLRFLKNCNNAAKHAKGEYILFLNNDTQVQEDWLAPLVSLIESDAKIGMVGSKLVYPDGKLQEAGGIIWKDASAWNYGHLCDPSQPEYNYVKEVDYISGAAIMIRSTLWKQIGGFDELFAPGYYEDSDLAFSVRKHGFKVMFQPLSIVVHFEGVSNGRDTSSGLKAYQEANQQKFHAKWKAVLEKEHFDNGQNVFLARDRSFNKPAILMIDQYVPTYDRDAGSRTIYQYIMLLSKMGFNIKFIGDNFVAIQPYTKVLQQIGVEILFGTYYQRNWKNWILDNSECITFAFLNRPHISEHYIDVIKNSTHAKIIYNLCDLHFLREQREAKITGDAKLLESALKWKEKEFDLIRKADVVLSLSTVEQSVLQSYGFGDKIVIAPIFIYPDFTPIPNRSKNTKDLLFVGGFTHHPNQDAVKWFCHDILPSILTTITDIKIHIVGSNPPLEIQKLASNSIVIEGYLSDEQLNHLYDTCRVCVIPLRYGAGVKGKTIEAMYHGIPVVTTTVGIEGLPGIEKCIKGIDTAHEFALRVIELYNSGEDLSARVCMDYVHKNYSEESAKHFFTRIFSKEEIPL